MCEIDGQPLLGTDHGPEMLRNGGLHEIIVDLGWCVEETGNLDFTRPAAGDPKLDPKYGRAKQCYAGKIFYACYVD